MSARNCMSTRMYPAPSHCSHLPPTTLNEKEPTFRLCILASRVEEKSLRISSNTFTYVMGLERGVRPIGDWSTRITSLTDCTPSILSYLPTNPVYPSFFFLIAYSLLTMLFL